MQILSVLKELAFFFFSQLVKYHQLYPFHNSLVKGKRQNSNQRYMVLSSHTGCLTTMKRNVVPTTCGSCNFENMKNIQNGKTFCTA